MPDQPLPCALDASPWAALWCGVLGPLPVASPFSSPCLFLLLLCLSLLFSCSPNPFSLSSHSPLPPPPPMPPPVWQSTTCIRKPPTSFILSFSPSFPASCPSLLILPTPGPLVGQHKPCLPSESPLISRRFSCPDRRRPTRPSNRTSPLICSQLALPCGAQRAEHDPCTPTHSALANRSSRPTDRHRLLLDRFVPAQGVASSSIAFAVTLVQVSDASTYSSIPAPPLAFRRSPLLNQPLFPPLIIHLC